MAVEKKLILASASPRRSDMLRGLGVPFEIFPADVNEDALPGEKPVELVTRLAREKAEAVSEHRPHDYVLAADTIVVLEEEEKSVVLGKPVDVADAKKMLRRLQGATHYVYSGYCITCKAASVERLGVCRSAVTFGKLGEAEIEAYVKTGEGADKAGAYALQGLGAWFVKNIEGSYSNVIGLPLWEVLSDLKELGVWSAEKLLPKN